MRFTLGFLGHLCPCCDCIYWRYVKDTAMYTIIIINNKGANNLAESVPTDIHHGINIIL